jgi:GNAT superfamily N-acetyltransferase
VGLWNPVGWPGIEVGWKLAPAAQGHGYATEAAAAAVGWAWTVLGLTELSSMIVAENAPSQRVARRLGETNTGPVELPIGTCDRWMISPPPGDERWALRDAAVDDAPRLARLLRESMARFREFSPPGWEPPAVTDEELAEMVAAPDAHCVLAAPGGVHAGHVAWRPSMTARRGPSDPDTAYLAQIYVEPAWWGTPLATKLMDIAVTAARAQGFKRMALITPAFQGRARRFYERHGWRAPGPPADDARFGMPTIAYALEL